MKEWENENEEREWRTKERDWEGEKENEKKWTWFMISEQLANKIPRIFSAIRNIFGFCI